MQKMMFCLMCFVGIFFAKAQDIETLLRQSQQALEQNRIKEAIAFAEKALALNPKSAEGYNARGLAYYAFSEYEKALADYTKAIELSPNYKEAFYNRGVCHYWLSKNDLALADFNKAISIDTTDARSYTALGGVYAQKALLTQSKEQHKYLQEAEKNYQKAIQLNPDFAQTYYNYASLIADSHPRKALEYAYQFLQRKPKDVEGLILAGLLHNQLKEYEKAIENLEKAVLINPSHSEAFAELAWANYKLKRKNEACQYWLKARELGNTDAEKFRKKYCK